MSRKVYQIVVMCLCFFMLKSCMTPGVPLRTTASANNQTYKVAYLFEHDGCRVYRFIDSGNCVYFTSCTGQTSYQVDSVTVIQNSTNMKW